MAEKNRSYMGRRNKKQNPTNFGSVSWKKTLYNKDTSSGTPVNSSGRRPQSSQTRNSSSCLHGTGGL